MRHLHPSDYLDMPWKDGGGVTTQIAIAPEGATVAGGFAWRLSKAQVAKSGPFSRFEGYDRHLALLQGEGFVLHVDGETHRLPAPHRPIAFPGEAEVQAELIGGPCIDFNLMVRRAHGRSEWQVVRDAAHLPEAPLLILHLLEGGLEFDALSLAAGDTLVWETHDRLGPLRSQAGPLLAYLARIWPN